MSQGQNKEKAIGTTKRTMTEPGYSEHHTGLAVDVVDRQWYDSYPETVLDHRFEVRQMAASGCKRMPGIRLYHSLPKKESRPLLRSIMNPLAFTLCWCRNCYIY